MTDLLTKALTIRDPWAQAIIHGPKRIENRGQRLDSMLGERVAIHVSKTIDKDAWHYATAVLGSKPPWSEYIAHEDLSHPGHIIGSVRLIGYCDARGDEIDHVQATFTERWHGGAPCPTTSEWWQGPVGWLLDDVVVYEPAPARGMPGFWTVDDDTRRLLEER